MRTTVLVLLSCITWLAACAQTSTHVTKQPFGTMPDGSLVEAFTLANGPIEVRILTYGGTIQSLRVPDRRGNAADVVLGFDTLEGYMGKDNPYFGALVGRYANRIAGGRFQLNGHGYTIPLNNGPNALHGGPRGFDKAVWKARDIKDGIELTHVSPDGDQGFPGTLTTTVRYTLKAKTLRIEYTATTDQDTVVNLTNHAYFNLAGEGTSDVLGHELRINAGRFTPVNSTLIPNGELRPVSGTALDFRRPQRIGDRIDADDEQLRFGGGYDHNWVLDRSNGQLNDAAELYEPGSGRVLQVFTTEPGLQFYSGNFLDGTVTGKGGKHYPRRSGLSLETQHFPDSPNHPSFPSTELKPGQSYHSITEFRFSVR
jgi:aldose 1-epimerase